MESQKKSFLNVPVAILIAGALVAGAVIYAKSPTSPSKQTSAETSFEDQFKKVTSKDHILGNPDAKIKIVEYSDPSCPFCKVFHNTMTKIMGEYGAGGNVAWVYRHYPLDKPNANGDILHPNAGKESEALECAANLGGNEKFWTYTNRLYEITPSVTGDSPDGLDPKELPKIAEFAKLNVTDFNNCLSTGKFKDKVESDYTDGVNIGINGTPTSVVVLNKAFPSSIKEKLMQIYEPFKNPQTGEYPISLSSDSKMIMLGGAMPYEIMKATIDLLGTY
ncbi:MAG TPA: thioredoxin domain-containing protein [Candidatus Paceibacterota bacterium]